MEIVKTKQIKLKSNKGFTLTDLAAALVVFTIFAATVSTLLYTAFKMNIQTKLSATAVNYAIQILEDIDKISYEEVNSGIESMYRQKLSIPVEYKVLIEVSNYNEGNDKEDLIKLVNLTITYEIAGINDKIAIQKLKVKEV